jgi:RNA polymerase sigma-70 factor (ECF subfamily)
VAETEPLRLDSTTELLRRTRRGDDGARDELFERFYPLLRRWAHGRLPARARGLSDTDDLVQDTLVRMLKHIETFDSQHEGAFLAYLRRGLLNRIRDQLRRVAARPGSEALSDQLTDGRPAPLEEQIGRETLERYEAALAKLQPGQREAVMLRVEFGYSYAQIADAMNRDTPNAARLLVVRALSRLALEMNDERRRG